jgi:UDP-N-acetylmuramyl pentapeptide phosphotransferase/UDP-N-acetylglucosamine-1-phosphate transferase
VAQTRKRRQTKHRGNAAGVVESRGRTGRKPTKEEKSGDFRLAARARERKKTDRRDLPPTWGGAFIRAMFAAVVMLILLLVLKWGKSNQVIMLFPIALLLYTPISYYTELWSFRRRQRAKAKAATGQKAASR